MKLLYFIFTFISCYFCTQEDLPDLDTLLKDPKALFKLEKRLGNLLEELDSDAESSPPPKVACSALEGTIGSGCTFNAKKSKIIKTTESLSRNAKFISDRRNVSCASDCIAFCCDDQDCDTSVYQDKDEHNCYLFQCGSPSRCVFADHDNYWMGSISKDVHATHNLVTGGATVTHENELQNLGTASATPKPDKTLQPPTVKTLVRTKPGLNGSCESYSVQCEDIHAECLMGVCKCRNGYHEKTGLCRERCREEEFECEQLEAGLSSRQCVHKSYMCDGNPDCTDGSDESNCADKHKPAYLDSDLIGSVYSNPLYNMPYGSQSEPQYPYGFPIPGLTNQQQSGLYSTNQLYPGQLPSAGNTGGGYYSPPQGQAGNVPKAGSQLKSQWPFIGSQLYPNNFPYQTNQQTGYIPQQQPVQPGYGQVVKQPAHAGQQINPNIQAAKQPAGQTGASVILQEPVSGGQVPGQVEAALQQAAGERPAGRKLQPQPPVGQAQQEPAPPGQPAEAGQDTPRIPPDDPADSYSAKKQTVPDSHANDHARQNPDVLDIPKNFDMFVGDVSTAAAAAAAVAADDDGYHNRHSVDVDDQVNKFHHDKTGVPQSSDNAQPHAQANLGKSKSNSEGYIDYSWIGYDSNSPRINGKKGPSQKDDTIETQKTTRKPVSIENTKQTNFISQQTQNPGSTNTGTAKTRIGDNRSGYQPNRYPGKFRTRFDDINRQSGGNRRPSYDRYPDQYSNNNNRHRPSHGSRYPFYESTYGRGRDRNPYPVWDSMKEEYYYPDDYDDKEFGSVPGMGGFGAGQQGLDYPYVQKGDSRANLKPSTVAEVPQKLVPETEAATVPLEKRPTTTSKSLSTNHDQSSQSANSKEVQLSDHKEDDPESSDSESPESQPADQQSHSPTNISKSPPEASGQFKFLNVDSMEVDSYTDNSQGPIVALSLGLAITVVLLVFVGCRLRTVKRRLRKGRALHSNEADYLINGMYL